MIMIRYGIILRSCNLDSSALLLRGASSHRRIANYRDSCLIVELVVDESLFVFKIISHWQITHTGVAEVAIFLSAFMDMIRGRGASTR